MKLQALFCLLLTISTAFTLAVDDSAPVATAVWPPAYLKELPPDYLARSRAALEKLASEFGALKLEDDPVVWVRLGLASLAVEKNVAAFNKYLERDDFSYPANADFGFGLFSAPFVRAYALFNSRTGFMKGRLSAKAQENLEKTLWICAKANSRLADAKRDVWAQEGSENHHVTSKVSDFLVSQYFKDLPAYAREKYDDGSTPGAQYEARRAYWLRWLDERAKKGLFDEDGSSYQNYTLEALLNLRDFAEDPILRRKADMFLDLVFANFAEETLGVQRGGPKTRTKEEHFHDNEYNLLFNPPGATLEPASYSFATSNYYPPPAIVSLARDLNHRGNYSFAKRAPDAVTLKGNEHTKIPGSKWATMDDENTMLRVGFATANYIIGSHGLDPAAKVEVGREQRWQGIVFANDPMARIGMDGKSGVAKGPYLSSPFQTIQDRNVMVTTKWAPVADDGADPHLWIYFSYALDAVEEGDGWIFAKSGHAFAGVKIVEGGYEWTQPWKHAETFSPAEKSFIKLNSENSPIITVVNDAADYANDFAAFQKALKAQPIQRKGDELKFATITHKGLSAPGQVNGRRVDPRPSNVNESPFIRSLRGSGIVYIRKGDETLLLDFSNTRNPVRTVNAKATLQFPSGHGEARPIIFR